MRSASQKTKNKTNLVSGHNEHSQSRRSFAKVGIVAPVVMSLVNRPAWGGAQRCTVSGFDSLVEIGSGDQETISCAQYSSSGDLAAGLTPPLEKFNDLFPTCQLSDNSLTVKAALENTGTEAESKRRRLFAAAELNARIGAGSNPLGCPVEPVYCFFKANSADPTAVYLISPTQVWTQEEFFTFMETVMEGVPLV